MGIKELKNRLLTQGQKLLKDIEDKKEIFILVNPSVDGIISSAILFISIFHNRGNTTVRCNQNINTLFEEDHDISILIGFDSSLYDKVQNKLDEKSFFFINNDPNINLEIKEKDNFINPWIWNIDGDTEISISAIVYLVAKTFDRDISFESFLPVISAISKEQDVGKDRELLGINSEILETAESLDLVMQKKMLTIAEIETASLIDVLENNIAHYIKDLTWNREKCEKVIQDSNISLFDRGHAKLFNEYGEDDFVKIMDSIEKYILQTTTSDKKSVMTHKEIKNIKNILFGNNYILLKEEENSFLRNAKYFGKALEYCINSGRPELALSICIGDRNNVLEELNKLVIDHNNLIKKSFLKVFNERWRYYDDQNILLINTEGIVEENNSDPFIYFLEKSISFSNRIIILRTLSNNDREKYIFKIVKTPFCIVDIDVIMNKLTQTSLISDLKKYDKNKIQCLVKIDNLEDFLSTIKKIVLDASVS